MNFFEGIRFAIIVSLVALVFPFTTFAFIDTDLQYGASGSQVGELQTFLIAKGFLSDRVTGYFYIRTKQAVIAYQKSLHLPPTGYVGSRTRVLINRQNLTGNTIQTNTPQKNAGTGRNNSNWNAPNSREIMYAENLPGCKGTALFTSPPAVGGTFDTISPLGQTSSSHGNAGHVFPVDHLYFDFTRTIPGDYASPSLPATVLSPGDIEIFQINTITYEKDGKDIASDYHVWFAPCREVTAYLGHINSLSPKIQDAIDHATEKSCGASFMTGSPADTTLKPCGYGLLLQLKSGEEIGTAGGPGVITSSFDFGVYDQRIPSLPFIDAKYWTPLNLHAVCGLHYYPDGEVKTNLLKKVNNTKKDQNGLPDCGTNMWDKNGTIQGNWVLPNTPRGRVPDMQGFAAIHLNTDPSQGLIDWGSAIAPADRIRFSIGNEGFINRDPADVKADGSIYCFQDTSHGTANARSVMVQLFDNKTLKAEYVKGICPFTPSFSSPTTYYR